MAPATETSVPPPAAPTGGNSVSAIGCAWNSNVAPKTVKLPATPARTSTATKPAACGGERQEADDAVTLPADAGTVVWSNLHPKKTKGSSFRFAIPAALMESSGTSPAAAPASASPPNGPRKCAPRAGTSVPPLAGPRVGSNPKTSSLAP